METQILIQHQNRKTLALKATPQGLIALIPRGLAADSPRVQQFIATGLQKLDQSSSNRGEKPSPMTSSNLRACVDAWAGRIGVQVKRVQIRSMYTKWASCSSSGTLTLNADLLALPSRLIDYVLCHELLHLKIPDHGKGFQAMIGCYVPDWRDRELELLSWVVGK